MFVDSVVNWCTKFSSANMTLQVYIRSCHAFTSFSRLNASRFIVSSVYMCAWVCVCDKLSLKFPCMHTHTHTFAVVPADELHFVCTSEDHCGSLKKEKSDCIFYWKRMHVLLNMKIWGCQIKQWWVCHACTWFCVLRMAPFWLSLHCSQ